MPFLPVLPSDYKIAKEKTYYIYLQNCFYLLGLLKFNEKVFLLLLF